LIMRGPGGFSGGKGLPDAMVTHLDIFPTLCELAGVANRRVVGRKILSCRWCAVRPPRSTVRFFAEVNYHASYEPKRAAQTRAVGILYSPLGGRKTPVLWPVTTASCARSLLAGKWMGKIAVVSRKSRSTTWYSILARNTISLRYHSTPNANGKLRQRPRALDEGDQRSLHARPSERPARRPARQQSDGISPAGTLHSSAQALADPGGRVAECSPPPGHLFCVFSDAALQPQGRLKSSYKV